jgi:hypothetical protein
LREFRAKNVKSSGQAKQLTKTGAASVGNGVGVPGVGGGYGPMAALARSDTGGREYESSLHGGALDGGGDSPTGLSDTGGSWLPAARQGDAPFVVSEVSWGPGTSVFDELAVPDQPEGPGYAEDSASTLERVSDRWVASPVIGGDKRLTL